MSIPTPSMHAARTASTVLADKAPQIRTRCVSPPRENWLFDENGLMRERHASINDVPIRIVDRKFLWERSGPRPKDHPGLGELNL